MNQNKKLSTFWPWLLNRQSYPNASEKKGNTPSSVTDNAEIQIILQSFNSPRNNNSRNCKFLLYMCIFEYILFYLKFTYLKLTILRAGKTSNFRIQFCNFIKKIFLEKSFVLKYVMFKVVLSNVISCVATAKVHCLKNYTFVCVFSNRCTMYATICNISGKTREMQK